MHYKTSDHFETALFGRCSGDQSYKEYQSFSRGMRALINKDIGPDYPATRLGELLYFGVYERIRRKGVDPSGLRLKPSTRSRLDVHHQTDGFYRLLSVPNYLVTIDLYNLDSEICEILRDRWEDEYSHVSESDFQTILLQYKFGMVDFWKIGGKITHWDRIFKPLNYFRSKKRRPKNHFILTPYYTEDRYKRRLFTEMVAEYFVEVMKESSHENMAQQSR